jgi:hypothetical protein
MARLRSSGALFSLISAITTASWLPGLAGQAQNIRDAGAEKSPMLLSGLGSHTHPISTQNSDAQKFFDQVSVLRIRSVRKISDLQNPPSRAPASCKLGP